MANYVKLIDSVYDSCMRKHKIQKLQKPRLKKPVFASEIVYDTLNYKAKLGLYNTNRYLKQFGEKFYNKVMGYDIWDIWYNIFSTYSGGNVCFNCGNSYPESALTTIYDADTDMGLGINLVGTGPNTTRATGTVTGMKETHVCKLCSAMIANRQYTDFVSKAGFNVVFPIALYKCSNCGKIAPYWAVIHSSFFLSYHDSKLLAVKDLAPGFICLECLKNAGLEMTIERSTSSSSEIKITNLSYEPSFTASWRSITKMVKPLPSPNKPELIRYIIDNTDTMPDEKPDNPKFSKYSTYKSAVTPAIIKNYIVESFIESNDAVMANIFKELGIPAHTYHGRNARVKADIKKELSSLYFGHQQADDGIVKEISNSGTSFSVVLIIPDSVFSYFNEGNNPGASINNIDTGIIEEYIQQLENIDLSCPYTTSGNWYGTKASLSTEYSDFQQNQFVANITFSLTNFSVDIDDDTLSILYEADFDLGMTKTQLTDEQLAEVVTAITKKKVKNRLN